jgi:serine/threonine protein kinase
MTARLPIRFSLPAPPRISTTRRQLPLSSTPEIPTQVPNISLGTEIIHENVDASSLRDFRRKFPNQQWSELVLKEQELLGRGSGVIARKVQDRRNGNVLLQKTIAMRERYVATLLKQISLISSVKHPNIVDFYGAYLSPTSREVNVITEFCDGGSLKSIGDNISRLQLVIPGERAMSQIINGIFQALNHLDSLGIIHGGIKPSNILLTRSGRVKLCDFGISEDLVYVGMDKLSVSYAAVSSFYSTTSQGPHLSFCRPH